MQTRQKLWLRSWGQLCELCQRTADKTVGYSCTVLFINDNSFGQVHSHICLIMLLKSGVALILFLFSLQASQIKELTDLSLAGLRDVKYRRFLEVSRPITYSSSIRALQEPLREPPRTKRSALFSTGVKVCPQESVKAVITSHQAYYKLRVCQEAIWEAFRIFFDRVPNSEEYMAWVYTCQYENLCMDDLARNFSNSQEHLDMVARRVAELGEREGVLEETPEPGRDCTWTPPYIMIPMDHEVVIEDPSVIPENQQQYIVEFSVTVVDPIYSELLRDPAAPEYNDIIRELRDKMYHIFEKIPGFKEIHVLGFQAENVSVQYAAVFNGDTELSDQPEGYEMIDVETQRDLNAPKLKHIIVRALKQELSLPLDLNTLSFVAVFPVEEHINNIAHTAAPPIEENSLSTVAVIKHLEASGISLEAHTFTPFIPKVLTDIIWVTPEQNPAHPAGGTGTKVENILTTEEELSAEPATIEPGAVVHAVSSDPPSQTPEVQVIVPASQDHTVQGIEADTKVESSPPAEKDEALEESSHQSGVPAPTVPTVKNILVPEETSENGTHAGTNQLLEEDSGSGLPSEADEGPYESTAAPAMRQASTPLMAAVDKSKDLVVFFSLRVTNMMFTDNLFNKNSPEYKSLENTFLELTQRSGLRKPPNPGASSKSGPKSQRTLASIPLLPYLETNLTGFKALEILSFRNGSVIVNSKMKLNKAVPYNITEAVHCVLEDFCNSASNQLDIQIDSRSLEIEQADQTDPCKFLACNEFSRCTVNSWSGEAECQCDPGYSTVGDHPCQSTCALQPDFCLNGGLCEIIPGHGATCRCPVGKYWHYHGERCDELITLPLDTPLILTSLVGSLCLVGSIIGILIFINKKCIKPQKAVTVVHTLAPYAFENTLRVNPVFQNDDGFLPQVSTLPYPSSSASSQSQQFEQEHFASIENIHLSIEIPRQLYTTRSEKLVSDMVDFHHCISHSTTWRPSNKDRTCCLLRASENDCFEVTVV